jgi:metal-responsive CopG/Arc/MetJ family transcriptional regulator
MARRPVKTGQITITMPQFIIEDIDELAKEIEISRSEVISDILRTVLRNEDMLNQVYPLEPEG